MALLAAGCGDPEPVKIGVLLPETGPAGTYAKAVRQAIDLAAEEVNAAGGIKGGPLVIVYRDTGSRSEAAQVAMRELVETEGVTAILGPITSTVALSIVPIATEKQIVVLSPAASSPRLTQEGGEYFFRNYPSDVVEGHTMAEFCRNLALDRVAVLATNDIFGKGISEIFIDKYQASTREVVLNESFESGLSAERAVELAKKVKSSGAKAVYMAAYEPDVAELLKALESEDVEIARLGTSAVTPKIAELAGEAAEHLIFPQTAFNPMDVSTPNVVNFVNAYKAKYGSNPDNYAAHSYDAVNVLATGLNKVAVPGDLRDLLWTDAFDGVTGRIDFNLQGDIVQAPRLYAILNGQRVSYDQFKEALVGQSILVP
jgi:branched-chain amino acid transport system substrate-binding protein